MIGETEVGNAGEQPARDSRLGVMDNNSGEALKNSPTHC